MRASASYSLTKVALFRANLSMSLKLSKKKMSSCTMARRRVFGEVFHESPKDLLLPYGNQYSGMGGKTPLARETKERMDNNWGGPEAEKLIIHLKDDILEAIKGYDSLLVFFYTSWCTHCKKMKSAYGEAAVKMMKEGVPGHLGAIDVTKKMDIADMFHIVAVPILKYFRKGNFIMVYNEKRTVDDIVKFMKSPPKTPLIVPKIDI